MAIDFEILPTHVQVKFGETYSIPELRERFQEIFSSENYRQDMPVFLDTREVQQHWDKEEILDIAGVFSRWHSQLSGRAAVVTDSKLRYGLARMVVAYASDPEMMEMEVFDCCHEADRWLKKVTGQHEQ